MFARLALHMIPAFVIFVEYLAITSSLKMAQTMGDYTTTELLGGIIRIGDNISYHALPVILLVMHVVSFLLAVFYFYAVTLRGLGRDSINPGDERISYWSLDND